MFVISWNRECGFWCNFRIYIYIYFDYFVESEIGNKLYIMCYWWNIKIVKENIKIGREKLEIYNLYVDINIKYDIDVNVFW